MTRFCRKLRAKIARLKAEKKAGSSACVHLALEAVLLFARSGYSHAEWPELYTQLTQAQPEMIAIAAALDECHAASLRSSDEWAAIERAANALLKEQQELPVKLAKQMSSLCKEGGRLLTHSASSTVEDVILLLAQERNIEVICTESRPQCEGVDLAARLARQGVAVSLIVDAAAATFLPQCQAVLLGADALGEDFFVNKVGSLGIVLAAQRLEIPCYLLCDRLKRLNGKQEWVAAAERPGEEIVASPPPAVAIRNPYFEKIPLFFIQETLL